MELLDTEISNCLAKFLMLISGFSVTELITAATVSSFSVTLFVQIRLVSRTLPVSSKRLTTLLTLNFEKF
jgi:hypothetical protein